MSSAFSDVWAEAQPAFDEEFGEAFVLIPSIKSGGSYVADPDRLPISVVGIFTDPFARAASGLRDGAHDPVSSGRGGSYPQHSSSRPSVSFQISSLVLRPKKFDKLQRVKTSEWFQVSEVRSDGEARILCDLNG
jgi:hypothetical protein